MSPTKQASLGGTAVCTDIKALGSPSRPLFTDAPTCFLAKGDIRAITEQAIAVGFVGFRGIAFIAVFCRYAATAMAAAMVQEIENATSLSGTCFSDAVLSATVVSFPAFRRYAVIVLAATVRLPIMDGWALDGTIVPVPTTPPAI